MVAATPKPRLVKLAITPQGEEPFSIGGSSRKATQYARWRDCRNILRSNNGVELSPIGLHWTPQQQRSSFLRRERLVKSTPSCFHHAYNLGFP